MKKTATLVAGLLLVTGTVLAGGLFAEGWSLSGSVAEGTLYLLDTQNGPLTNDGGDLELKLKASKEGELGNFAVEVNMEQRKTKTVDGVKKSDSDHEVVATYSRRQGNFEVSLGATLISNDDKTAESGTSEFRLETKANDGTFLRWFVTDTLTATYYPWEVADFSWDKDTFESFNNFGENKQATKIDKKHENKGGLALAMKVNEDTTATFKYAIIGGNGNHGENFFAYKAELVTKLGDAKVEAYAGLTNGFMVEGKNKTENLFALGAQAVLPVGDALTVTAEFNMENVKGRKAGDKKIENALGLFAKGEMKLDDIAEYKASVYGSFKYLNDAVQENDKAEKFTELEAGLTLAQGNFSVTPKVVLEMQKKGFKQYDKDVNKEKDSRFKAGVTFKYEL